MIFVFKEKGKSRFWVQLAVREPVSGEACAQVGSVSQPCSSARPCSPFFHQVDIMQMCIIELKDRQGQPLFHLEHYIEGKYIKYNSNSGFVRDDNIRLTPQVRRWACSTHTFTLQPLGKAQLERGGRGRRRREGGRERGRARGWSLTSSKAPHVH